MRSRLGLVLLPAAGLCACVALGESAELEVPEIEPPVATTGEPTVPTVAPPAMGSATPTHRRRGPERSSCAAIVADAQSEVRADLEAICTSGTHDGSCVGFACDRTPSREAFECLLEAGETAQLYALAGADVPAARAFAREAMTRTTAWTPDRIRAALADEAHVTACFGCVCSEEQLSIQGLSAVLDMPDRAAALPLLRAWAAGRTPLGLPRALLERGDEGWIESDRLKTITRDEEAKADLRVAAAHALARRGVRTDTAVLYALTRSDSWWVREVAVQTLDLLDDARAWTKLAHLLQDDSGHVRLALMRLGARLVPNEAVKAIDADTIVGPSAISALPARLRKARIDREPPAEPPPDRVRPDCHRTAAASRRRDAAIERERLLDLERRAKAAAGH